MKFSNYPQARLISWLWKIIKSMFVVVALCLLSSSCNSGAMPLTEERCLKVLEQYVDSHPKNVTCVNKGDSPIYEFSTNDGFTLVIDTSTHKYKLIKK